MNICGGIYFSACIPSNALEFKCGRGFYEFTKPEIISHKKEVNYLS